MAKPGVIPRHGPEDFEGMRRAGRLAAMTLDFIAPYVQPGVPTTELDRLCAAFIAEAGAISAPLGYRGFPRSICTSVNHVVCHGIPGDKRLEEGDIVNIDVTPVLDGWYGDSSRMYYAGKPGVKARKLVEVGVHELREIADVIPAHHPHRTLPPLQCVAHERFSVSYLCRSSATRTTRFVP